MLATWEVRCQGSPTPIVDLRGKDPVKVNQDMADCQVSHGNTFAVGNPIANCMKGKGYTLMGVY
ncbi:MAG: hypothetical protein AAB403_12270 [Planctomycetota bacterium]